MSLVVAVHDRPGSFSDRWIEVLRRHGVEHKTVNCLDSDIIAQLDGVHCLLWHFYHLNLNDLNFARFILYAAQERGIRVFPDLRTNIHFDDKIAQKFLLEALVAPLVPTWVFFEREAAEAWIDHATFPKVFKLRRGAGAANVRLVRDRGEARRLCRVAFGRGFYPLKETSAAAMGRIMAGLEAGSASVLARDIAKRVLRKSSRVRFPPERDYVYFQEFVPENAFDIRVTVIGQRAFIFRRGVRNSDFRASGSGKIVHYEPGKADLESVRIALETARKLKTQSMAFDFVVDHESGRRLIVEISYGYLAEPIRECGGFYDEHLAWTPGEYWPQDLILDDLIRSSISARDI